MNKLQMNSAWHIQNLIESEPDCQVVTLHDANLYVDELEARIAELEGILNIADKYIHLEDMPEKGAFTVIWTFEGHTFSKSAQWIDGELREYSEQNDDDGTDAWIDYDPLNSMQINPIYIASKVES